MFPVLASLAQGGVVQILSLMDNRGAPHGQVVDDNLAVCWGVDIAGYAGNTINLVNAASDDKVPPEKVASTIAGVAAVIANLPAGRYRLGLTRPSTGAGGPPMPSKDVFLLYNPPQFPMYAHLP